MRDVRRLVWLLPAGFSLLAGLNAALILLGLPAVVSGARFADVHGMLLVLGFLGTLISLERATALRRWWGYLAPALLGVGGILLVIDPAPILVGKLVLTAGAFAFTLNYVPLWRRRYDTPLIVQLLGSAIATGAAALWTAGAPMERIVPWLIAFIVLTICAERVELAAIAMGSRANTVLLLHSWAIALALLVALPVPVAGTVLLGVSLASLTLWLMWNDIARRTIRGRGVTQFMAACMLAGYVWLLVAAVVLMLGPPVTTARYDAAIHSVLLGFALSMIMAHATTILPAVLGITLPYRRIMWLPALLLHASLIVRVWIGDGLGVQLAWQVGGALGVAALLVFAVTMVGSAIAPPPPTPAKTPAPSPLTKDHHHA